jgi:hypothetical protein
MRTYVMIDAETLALTPNAVVLSFGAVAYTYDEGIFSRIEIFPNLDEQLADGRDLNADTLFWWFRQPPHSRVSIADAQRQSLYVAANAFDEWIKTVYTYHSDRENVFFVANGVDFDLPILSTLMTPFIKVPWEGRPGYRQKICFRTLNNLFGTEIEWPQNQASHTALADAETQAQAHLSLLRKYPRLA